MPITDPKAISGDRIEPEWDELLTITVGPREGDLVGTSEKVLQAAVDYVARRGGGTVRILPGTFRLRNAVYLPSKIRILGSGPETILIKEPSVATKLSANSDWYDQEITLADARGFQVGDGVCFRAKNPDNGGPVVIKRTLVARSGNRFKLDKALRENFWPKGEPTAATPLPPLLGEDVSDVAIENLALDGNRANNDNLDGNYAGCIFLQDCSRLTIRGVIARNYNGDGISWQICHDVLVEDCQSHDHAGLGLHPGSGSQRPIMRNNRVKRNDIGIFFCWGVRTAWPRRTRSRTTGARASRSATATPTTSSATTRSSAAARSASSSATSATSSPPTATASRTTASSTAAPTTASPSTSRARPSRSPSPATRSARPARPESRIGIRIGPKARDIALADNRIEGFSREVSDLRSA